jgi:hypothetical protein
MLYSVRSLPGLTREASPGWLCLLESLGHAPSETEAMTPWRKRSRFLHRDTVRDAQRPSRPNATYLSETSAA